MNSLNTSETSGGKWKHEQISDLINRYDEPRPLVRGWGKCPQYSSRKTSNDIKDFRLWSMYSLDRAG